MKEIRLDWPDKTAILCPLCSQLSRSIRLLAPYLSLEIGLSGPWPKALGGRATSIPRQPLFLFWLPASLLGLTGHWPPAFSTAKTPLSPQSIKTVTQTSLFLSFEGKIILLLMWVCKHINIRDGKTNQASFISLWNKAVIVNWLEIQFYHLELKLIFNINHH